MKQASEYRRQAALCSETAQRMSLKADRLRMTEMAQQWLALAEKAEAARQNQPETPETCRPGGGANDL
jgi:hypothetical protein